MLTINPLAAYSLDMNKDVLKSRARAGGKARGWQERKAALEQYHQKPHFCKHCGDMLVVGDKRVADIKKKQFCDSSCAASYNNKAHPERYSRSSLDTDGFITVA